MTSKKVKEYGKKAADLFGIIGTVTKDDKISKLSKNIKRAAANEQLVASLAKLFGGSRSESENEVDGDDDDNALESDEGNKSILTAGIGIENEDDQPDSAAADNGDSHSNGDQDGDDKKDEEELIIEKVKGQFHKIPISIEKINCIFLLIIPNSLVWMLPPFRRTPPLRIENPL